MDHNLSASHFLHIPVEVVKPKEMGVESPEENKIHGALAWGVGTE